jgi:hypothetical protein
MKRNRGIGIVFPEYVPIVDGKTRKRPVFKDRPLVKETVNLSSLLSGRAGHDGYRGNHSLHLGSPAAIPFYRPRDP